MKHRVLLNACIFFLTASLTAQGIVGAWEGLTKDENGKEVTLSVIFSEKYQVATWYEKETGAFVSSNGGTWYLDGNTMTETVEFDTDSSARVGSSVSFEIERTEDRMKIVGSEMELSRVDGGGPGVLAGAWLISGRMRNGSIQPRDTDRPRKTMKILSGTRFQWIAYNTETKEFMGTGGGTYTTVDGKYTENIQFFSRDDKRVGASLEFSYELKEGTWHHSGKSSRGEPMYEIWSIRMK